MPVRWLTNVRGVLTSYEQRFGLVGQQALSLATALRTARFLPTIRWQAFQQGMCTCLSYWYLAKTKQNLIFSIDFIDSCGI